jgi:putative ABC transport system ATP-binding protein
VSTPPDAIVQLVGAVKEYPLGNLTVRAVDQVDLTVQRGEFTVIAGPSGSGKTTMLNLIGCIDVPTSGDVRVAGKQTRQLSDRQLTQLRLDTLGFIFQSFNLINVLDVYQNVEFPLLLKGDIPEAERRRTVTEMVQKVGLADHLRKRPNELSGGQRQRVAIARALVTRPAIVLADEPTANLDSKTGSAIVDLMRELNLSERTTFIFSTHDHHVMERADRVVQILDGRIHHDDVLPPFGAGVAL